MADIEIHRKHHLGISGARAAADEVKERLGRKFGLEGSWDGDTLRFERPGLTGVLALTADTVKLSVALGFLLKAMKGSIERAATDELDALFGRHEAPRR